MNIPSEIESILSQHASLHFVEESKKVKCELSGHEMPPTEAALTSYISGKKYKKLRDQHDAEAELEKYKQHIVPSKKKHHERQLFCMLTWRHLNKEPVHHILQHVRGKRFQRALARWEHCQETGERFHPRRSNPVPRDDTIPGDEMFANSDGEGGGHEDDDDDDDMKDLYPDEDFADENVAPEKSNERMEDSDPDFQDLDDMEDDSEARAPPKKKSKTDTSSQPKPGSSQKPKKKKKKNHKKQMKQKT